MQAQDYSTAVTVEDLRNSTNQLVLFKLPRSVDPSLLEGKKIKLGKKRKSSKDLLSIQDHNQAEYHLQLVPDSHKDFCTIFSSNKEKGKGLYPANMAFTYELELVQKTPVLSINQEGLNNNKQEVNSPRSVAAPDFFREPYVPLKQKEGLKVRFRPSGSGNKQQVLLVKGKAKDDSHEKKKKMEKSGEKGLEKKKKKRKAADDVDVASAPEKRAKKKKGKFDNKK